MVMGNLRQETDVVVIGAGPGGYVAALRAADLGREVLLVDDRPRPGGTCLLEGCIPSKSLIHAVGLIESARAAREIGLGFADPSVDLDRLRAWTEGVVAKLSQGIEALLERRGVELVRGRARFTGEHALAVEGSPVSGIDFRHCVIATGSRASRVERLEPAGGPAPWTSAEALGIPCVPERLLVVGGGYIGLELGQVYAGLGAAVTLAELSPRLLAAADPDLVKVVLRRCEQRFDALLLDSRVIGVERTGQGGVALVEQAGETRRVAFDQMLVAAGRRPNTAGLGLEQIGVRCDAGGAGGAGGRIRVTSEMRTSVRHIFAIGDVAPGPMLAHKASREGKVAAEVIAGQPAAFDNRSIPAVVFTDPEIAWTGLTEQEARARGRAVNVGRFPLAALGRARTLGRPEGLAKVLSDPATGLVLGVGLVGPMASELIAEGALALEMGATLEDLVVTIHPHPTMSEALLEAAEVAAGAAIHVHPRRREVRAP